MWTVIYMATDKDTAQKVEQVLKSEGILVKTREAMRSKKHGCCIEILVPESEAQEAQKVILEKNL
ncbi:MAG: hypothetical protein PWR06_787 [Thermoanaerobacteraceae bacterium]|uniref:Glutamate decarboxylase n=1 Tax=Biomaibacter acetigenes TaxID=2316383 RepID=A0A3G2R487_9FIRM|nr:hypothetical protein [Biomaibacter acetigenes]AYO30171.1 hypothetical protein D2962_05675 [Biomaibacter acetigenes]MDK2878071.1 hypothetical protein [Thermoanaerobacteraceae bacterium]MDN5301553.1 hypothetical protein [Thermoanaerobacteraceae bacterium]RKL62220.1 hypothetical protein DXT63_12790 [Thermoanaerobacteraceae bacterium SP2]